MRRHEASYILVLLLLLGFLGSVQGGDLRASEQGDPAFPAVSLFPSPAFHRPVNKVLPSLGLDVRLGFSAQGPSLARVSDATRAFPFRLGVNVGPEVTLGSGAWALALWPRFQYQEAGDFYREVYGLGFAATAVHRWVRGYHVFGLGLGVQGSLLFGPMLTVAGESQLRLPVRWSYYPLPQLGVTVEFAPLVGVVSLRGKRDVAIGEMDRNLASDLTAGGEVSVGFCFP